jgi:hypothetical protein
VLLRNPITGIAGCCARAASGHAAALPSPAINSRRRILKSFPWIKEAYRGKGCKGTGFALQPGSLHCVSPQVAHRFRYRSAASYLLLKPYR